MKKILFVENRHRTGVWMCLASALRKDGYEIRWIVENHLFAPGSEYGPALVIPYPSEKDLEKAEPYQSQYLPSSDRAINYFGLRDTRHYGYYFAAIRAYLEKEKPDVVFGESTAFHELICIDACQRLGILYLHPSTCRYPTGRFAFYRYNTLEPWGGSNETLEDAAAQAQIDAIAARAVIPDYMKKKKVSFRTRMERLSDLLFLCRCYYGGEHYHTPSPFRKVCLDRKLKQWISRWDQAVRRKFSAIEGNAVKILYPLQMQPEANLDIWGNPYRNQAALISEILAHTPDDVLLVVKANPKTKYEFTDELLELVETRERIIPVPRNLSMGAVLPKVQLVITVTGTIAIECILSGKPVLTLMKTLNNTVPACPYLEHISRLPEYLDQIREGTFPLASPREKIDFLNLLNRTSYPGYPYENILRDPEEQAKVLTAFRSLLNSL